MIGGCSAEPIRVDRDRIDDCERPTVRTKLPLAQAGLSIDVSGLFLHGGVTSIAMQPLWPLALM